MGLDLTPGSCFRLHAGDPYIEDIWESNSCLGAFSFGLCLTLHVSVCLSRKEGREEGKTVKMREEKKERHFSVNNTVVRIFFQI